MKLDDIKPGIWVRVHTVGSTAGMLISPANLAHRREGAVGRVHGHVPGHGGDVWWVVHKDRPDEVAAYSFNEIEPHEPLPEAPEDSDSILD